MRIQSGRVVRDRWLPSEHSGAHRLPRLVSQAAPQRTRGDGELYVRVMTGSKDAPRTTSAEPTTCHGLSSYAETRRRPALHPASEAGTWP